MTDCRYCQHYTVEDGQIEGKDYLRIHCNRTENTQMMCSSYDCPYYKENKED